MLAALALALERVRPAVILAQLSMKVALHI